MRNDLLIGISYCGTHNKGDALGSPAAVMVPPKEHAEWLLAAVDFYRDLGLKLGRCVRVIVSAVGLPATFDLTAPGERDAMWRVLQDATVISYPHNPGHQVGAALGIRQGLEAAGYWNYPLYLHTAEDVLPWPGAVEKMLAALDKGADYAGFCWTDMLNCQFFGCRTTAIAGCFDIEAVRGYQGLEHYLNDLFLDRPKKVVGGQGYYLTTHDWPQYRSWLTKLPESTAPPVVRTMQDYENRKPWFAEK